jgi:hypothetical protein
MEQLEEVKTVPILGIYGMIPVIHECSKCPWRKDGGCDVQEYKDQGYCYTYKDRED